MVRLTPIYSRPLCRTFGTEAAKIWKDMEDATATGIIRDEETITNDLLLNVQRAHPYEVLTFQFTKPLEKHTGADWEWWLTDGRLWFGLLIQAKRLDPKSHKYQHIKQKRKIPQLDLLIEQARLKHPGLFLLQLQQHRACGIYGIVAAPV